ncbi:MAG: DUF1290 domain-containing protein [bacterium]|nr:DUF1290 domain-containing protein [bacterium]
MLVALFGLIVGIAIGALFPITIPLVYARYTAVAVIGLFDSVIGALRANMQRKYNTSIFVSGAILNMVLAMTLTFLGDRLSLDLYLAVVVVFTIRIFKNMAQLRYGLLTKALGRSRIEREILTPKV